MLIEQILLPTQYEALNPTHNLETDLCVYQGGFGSGKTYAGVLFGYAKAVQWPGSRGLVCAHTREMVSDTTEEDWRDIVRPSEVLRWKSKPDRLYFKNGSEVWFSQADKKKVRSTKFNWIHIEEGSLLSWEMYKEVEARLRRPGDPSWPNYQRRLLVTTNPQETPGWIDRKFGPMSKSPIKNRRLIAPTYENVFLLREASDYVDNLRDNFDTEAQKVYIEGRTGNLGAGAVYYQFRNDRNVSDHVAYGPSLPIHITFDFNVSFMYAAIFQEQPQSHEQQRAKIPIITHCIDEIAIKSSSTQDVCDTFMNDYRGHRAGVRVYGDPSGMHRDTRSTENDFDVIRRSLGVMPGFALLVRPNDGATGAFRIRNRAVTVNNMLEKGRYIISPECKHLIRSISETRWDPNKEGLWKKHKDPNPASDEFVVDHPHDAADYYFAKRWPYSPKAMTFK